jgi:hypothetical protein
MSGFMLVSSRTKKQAAVLALAVCLSLILGCENEFMKKAAEALSPNQPVKGFNLEWNTDVVYIDPLSGTLAGTISGLWDNAGKQVWFSKDIAYEREWDVPKPAKELAYEQSADGFPPGYITAGSITALLSAGTPPHTTDGDKIEMILSGSAAIIDTTAFDPTPYQNGGVTYSFILYPNAFYGPDRNNVISEKLEHSFRLELPTKTSYSARVKIEKAEYGSISVSWAEGSAYENAQDAWDGMKAIAGSYAAASALQAVQDWDPGNWAWTDGTGYSGVVVGVPGTDPPEALAAVSWNNQPDTSKSYAVYDKYAITLSPYYYTDEAATGPVQAVVSMPIEFTSDVGNTVSAIKIVEKAGSFSIEYTEGAKTAIEGVIATCAVTGTSINVTTWSPPYPDPEEGPMAPTTYKLTVEVGPGGDSSLTDTLEVTAVISPAVQ